MKVAAALAAGNCVICKPAEITPFAPELFAQLCKEAGVPDGVLSILPGNAECGEAIVRHKKIRKISFTGGPITRSEEHTSELQSLMRISYAVFCLKKKNTKKRQKYTI